MTTDHPVFREIITKAICGKGTFRYLRSIDLELPAGHENIQVLGNFVSNASLLDAKVVDRPRVGKTVQVKGQYDVHVWYAYDQETCAAKTTVNFIENIPIQVYGEENITGQQAFAEITHKPRCRKAYIKNLGDKSVVRVEIEQDLAAQVVGYTKLKVGLNSSAASALNPIRGQELFPPQNSEPGCGPNPCFNYMDLKCEEDLPEEDDEDNEYYQDEYDN